MKFSLVSLFSKNQAFEELNKIKFNEEFFLLKLNATVLVIFQSHFSI